MRIVAAGASKLRPGASPGVSVIISSFNYERYIGAAIDSALEQADAEVIVVDDGSRDGSREVIESFGGRVRAIFKANAGQASALNAGFAASRGNAVIFLDSDDLLLPGAARAVAGALSDRSLAKVHWPMPIIDEQGRRTGEIQDAELAEGDLRRHVIEDGPLSDLTMPSPPTSGNAFPRAFLERVMPIPESTYSTSPDEYLFGLAPAFGAIARLAPQSLYRMHGQNAHITRSFERMLRFQEEHYATVAAIVTDACRSEGIAHDERAWEQSAWWLRTGHVVRTIEAVVPAGERIALIDQGLLGIGGELRGRLVVPFPEADGEFAGAPGGDVEALAELERALGAGIDYVAVAWPAFWWLEEYAGLAAALRALPALVVADQDLLIFAREGR